MYIVGVPDKHIAFYAERKGLIYGGKVPKKAKCVVQIIRYESEKPSLSGGVRQEYSVCVDKRKRSEKKLVIYRMIQPRVVGIYEKP